MKIHAKDIWDNMKHYETPFIEKLIEKIGNKVQYDDDVVEFTLEVKDLKVRRAK
jgi:hypothetical protein